MGQFSWTNEALVNKIDQEGSILEAAIWGIDESDILDPAVAKLWARLTPIINEYNKIEQEILNLLDGATD